MTTYQIERVVDNGGRSAGRRYTILVVDQVQATHPHEALVAFADSHHLDDITLCGQHTMTIPGRQYRAI